MNQLLQEMHEFNNPVVNDAPLGKASGYTDTPKAPTQDRRAKVKKIAQGRGRRLQRQQDAAARRAESDKLTTEQKLAKIVAKRQTYGFAAKRETKRVLAQLEREIEQRKAADAQAAKERAEAEQRKANKQAKAKAQR